jgi:magnesium-protoporphyrin IX monomethyl ester (oxidative) cyclase
MSSSLEAAKIQARVPKETILTPRFYTTDFEAIGKMSLGDREADFRAYPVG